MTIAYRHPCQAFTVIPYDYGFRAWCSCGWTSGGWTTRALALAALGRHLKATADA